MNIFYITSINTNNKGGLFLAVYERVKRHSENLDNYIIINNNYFDGFLISLVRKILHIEDKTQFLDNNINYYKEIKINNLNYKKRIIYYLRKIFSIGDCTDEVVKYYYKKYKDILHKTDNIHVHSGWPMCYIAYKLSLKLSIPYFITFHGSDINNLKTNHKYKMLLSMKNASNCFFVSRILLEKAKKLGYSGENAKVIYNGVDTNKFKLKELQSKNLTKTVGFIGTLKYKKGADLLPQIFSEIIHLAKVNIEFLVIGDGELYKDIKSKFDDKSMNVTFLGNIEPEEVPSELVKIDVLVVPSRSEGFGMVILEANATGVPAVGTNVGGIPEAIGKYSCENVIKFDNNMITNLSERVVQLLNSDIDISQYRNRVKKEFNWLDIVKEEYSYYKKTIDD